MEENTEKHNLNIYINRKTSFTFDRKSIFYKKINNVRTKLLKIIDKEVTNYIKNKTMINSKTTPIYLKTKFTNIIINLKTKQINSTQETRTGFFSFNKLIKIFSNETKLSLDINPFLINSYNHYNQFKHKKKYILAKNSSNNSKLYNGNSTLLSPSSVEYNLSPYREKHLYKLTGKIRRKAYFTYLQSLFYSFHKNKCRSKVESAKNIIAFNNFNIQNIDKKIKKMDSCIKLIERHNSNNDKGDYELKKSSLENDIFTSNIIHLIRCKKIKSVI
jgi:hypothetical protein